MAEHSIWGASSPGALTHYSDGGGSLYVANAFYKFTGTDAWTCTGARLYVPTGTLPWTGQTPVTMYAWLEAFPSAASPTWAAPVATATISTLVEGWNEVHWASPISFKRVNDSTSPQRIWIGYKTADGNGYTHLIAADGAKQATDGSALYWSENAPGSYLSSANSLAVVDAHVTYGIDLLVDDGATTVNTATLTATLPRLTGSLSATAKNPATLSATLPRLTGSLTVAGATNTATIDAKFPMLRASLTAASGALTIAQENALTDGVADQSWWYQYGADTIPGFPRSTYYAPGEVAQFSIDYNSAFTADVWRLGWYGGNGGRKVAAGIPVTPTSQPTPAIIPGSNGAVTCAGWSVNATWQIPTNATPGWYWLLAANTAKTAFGGILFCVTDKAAKHPIVVMASDATWHAAYNGYGGNNVYGATPAVGTIDGRALCSSYDKPVITRDNVPQTHFFDGELPLLRFYERMGLSVGYTTCEQVNNDPTILDGRSLIVFNGHNEYISQTIRDKVAERISAGVNVANFAGNDFFWKTRYGGSTFPTTDTSTGRVMWVKKDTMDGPSALGSHTGGTPFTTAADWTGTWQDTRWANRQPPSALFGDRFIANGIRNDALTVPAAKKASPIWRNCAGIQALSSGSFSFGAGTLGMEWDMPDDRPGALPSVLLSSTTVDITGSEADLNGQNYNLGGTATHAVQMVRSGAAFVVNFNTTQWGWAVDDLHLRGTAVATTEARQATVNVLADLGAVPDPTSVVAAGLTVPTPVADVATAYQVPAAAAPPVKVGGQQVTAVKVGTQTVARIYIGTQFLYTS